AAKKPAGIYRIFILGESAAMGDPEPEFGAGRYLEILLRERFPKAAFEVVNTAMTAINSHAILPIARDCAGREGDLWILYAGNNEMVGPFGAATVFGPKAPSLPMIRLYLAAQQLRAGQLALNVSRKFKGASQSESWAGMEMFLGSQVAPGLPAREAVYGNFHRNLTDIVQTGLDSGAKVLLNTVAVNVRDCPPFASLHSVGVSPADRSACDTNYQAGLMAEQSGDFSQAAADFARAATFDAHLADMQYQWGTALLKFTNAPAAAVHFQQACDDDALPFRATSQINAIIRDLGGRLAGPNLDFLDAAGVLQTHTPTGICGQESFYEHVHLNFDGNYRLACAWAGEVEKFLPDSLRSGARGEWISQSECEQFLGLTDWDRYNVTTELASRRQQPPLNSQSNNGPLLSGLMNQVAQLKQRMQSAANRNEARGVYVEAMRLSPEDYSIRADYAEFLTDSGETGAAIEQWQQLRELFPQAYASYYQLGRLSADQHQFDRAKQLFAQTLAMQPGFAPGWFDLASVQAATSNYDLAITAFDQALRFNPKDSHYWFCAGLARAMAGRRAEAIEHYRQAARLDPGNWQAHFEMGGLLGQDGDFAGAKTESEAAIRLNPAFPIAHLNLGLALKELGDLQGAKNQLEETLRLDPKNTRAADHLAQVNSLLSAKESAGPASNVGKPY
ncbi:MAG TPA: tetratricopeptide repeat protein, partial [Candidatus Acidoferrum sp.]|nr:tetratricopeptide repeat protein [Candidatus Acidoferrum sp.]